MLTASHHNLLVELLIEGRNPYAADALSQDEARALRKGLQPGESVTAVLRGVTPRTGQTVWALAGSRVVMARTGWRGECAAMDVASVRAIDVVRGKYGVTIGLSTAAERRSVYGADRALALAFAQAVCARSGAALSVAKLDALRPDEAQEAEGMARAAATSLAT